MTSDLGGGRLAIETAWDDPRTPLHGLHFRALDAPVGDARVVDQDPGGAWIEIAPRPTRSLAPGSAFEVTSDDEAPIFAARVLTGTAAGGPLPAAQIRLATTLGTNALLERRGAPTALFVTRGFGDVLRIGTQQRPELFRLDARRPEPLATVTVEVDERLDAHGRVLRPIDLAALEPVARALVLRGIESAAIAFVHAWRNPEHEQALASALGGWGFAHVSSSASLAPRIRLLPRAETATIDAHLAPVVGGFLGRVTAHLPAGGLLVMTSAGGLVASESARPKDLLLSGPAGGVVGAAAAARRLAVARGIAFDMGGTSTDVARFEDEFEVRREHRVGAAEIAAPALAIESVAAGGGSICRFDGERILVGPESAGASPGPACYGAGGPLTLTDVNLLLGRLDPQRFGIPIDPRPAARRRDELLAELERFTGARHDPRVVLQGIVDIADETMAGAIRRISVRRGFDPAEHVLIAFGGAGGQHACGVAERLGMGRIVLPPDAGLLSAVGLGHARVERIAERQILEPLERVRPLLEGWIAALEREACAAVDRATVEGTTAVVRRRSLFLRLSGQDASLDVEWQLGSDLHATFEQRYADLYGHAPAERPIELEAIRVLASTPPVAIDRAALPAHGSTPPCTRRVGDLPAFDRDDLAPGATMAGPALVLERHATTFVAPGWLATVASDLALVIERTACVAQQPVAESAPESSVSPVVLELFTRRFTALVEEMGERLERTAVSTNVKERLDFSCALLDRAGQLVVNAPHIPVHLGALGVCVRAVVAALPLGPGDVGADEPPGLRRLAPARRDRHHTGARRWTRLAAPGLRGEPRAPRGDRRHPTGIDAPARQRRLARGRCRDPADAARRAWPSALDRDPARSRRGALALTRRRRQPGRPRAQRSRRTTPAPSACARSCSGTDCDTVLRAHAAPLGARGRSRARDAPRRGDGVHEAEQRLDDGTPLRVRIEVTDGRATLRLHGHGWRAPGQPQRHAGDRAQRRRSTWSRLLLARSAAAERGAAARRGDPPPAGEPARSAVRRRSAPCARGRRRERRDEPAPGRHAARARSASPRAARAR